LVIYLAFDVAVVLWNVFLVLPVLFIELFTIDHFFQYRSLLFKVLSFLFICLDLFIIFITSISLFFFCFYVFSLFHLRYLLFFSSLGSECVCFTYRELPQRSCLSPILFNIYVVPISQVLASNDCFFQQISFFVSKLNITFPTIFFSMLAPLQPNIMLS